MNYHCLEPDPSIALFVKSILLFEESDTALQTALPFFADGYPGLMFQQSAAGLEVMPHRKRMPPLFLYGQTLKPIELRLSGSYQLIVFQLYPFVLKAFFGVEAQAINDNCYDVAQSAQGAAIADQLLKVQGLKRRTGLISGYLQTLFEERRSGLDEAVRKSILLLLQHRQELSIKAISKSVHLTERTFERRFLKEAGLSARQFLQVIRFQQSLEQLTLKEHSKLNDIVYNNGFADQSHFIRVFKAFTGKTPKAFLKKQA